MAYVRILVYAKFVMYITAYVALKWTPAQSSPIQACLRALTLKKKVGKFNTNVALT